MSERRGKRVLLVEADLDAPALHKVMRLNVPRGYGFSEQLESIAGQTSSQSASDVTLLRVGPDIHALVESNFGTPALFDSPEFSAVLAQQSTMHDVIVIDGPVVDDWPDAQSLKSARDVVVFVVASGTSLADAMTLSNKHFEGEAILVRTIKTGRWPDV
jgi:Mrp family chromosome partitioning ATPase